MRKIMAAGIACFFYLTGPSAWAHYPFETSVVAALRHGRLEVEVDMASQMASLLVQDPEDPEAASLTPGTLEHYRSDLEHRAGKLYEITAGGTVLVPDRVVASVSEANHLKLVLFYPDPTAWPLKFHALRLENVPPGYTSALRVKNDDEKILGLKTMAPQLQKDVELSVSPKPAGKPPVHETSATSPPAPGKPFRTPLLPVLIVALCGAAVLLWLWHGGRRKP